MNTPSELRRRAAERLEAMRAFLSPEVRATLLSMAQRWNELADRAERGPPRP